jgi:hypothetical protein
MYYDSLMQGKGLIKRSKQIQIAGQSIYLIVAIALILLRFNLIAVVSAQALSVIIRRILAYRTIYTPEFKQRLQSVKAQVRKEILKPIYPNAVKVGLASLGEFLVSRSALIIGGLFLSLHEVASYGLSLQIIMIIATISVVYFASYQPKIAQYKVHGNDHAIVLIYLKSCGMMLFAFITGGLGLFFWGDWALQIIKSQTSLLSSPFLAAMLVISFLDYNRGMAGWVLVSGNSVPFFKSNLITAGTNLCLLFIFLQYTNAGIWGLILAQGTTQGIYQNWKWPIKVVKELHIKKIVTIYLKNVFMNKAILKKVTPGFVLFLWRKYNNNKEGRKREIMRTQIVNYLENIHPNGMTDEKQVVLDFLKCHSLSYFPYSYTEKYNPKDIVVYTDKERKMHYVLHDNKRLYFKRSYDKDTVKECYKNLLMEQDMASPHRYENADFRVHEGDVVADAGAAEGIFALSVVERAKELYLFEADKEWIAPLEATFTPFGDKVHIVNSYVSDKWIGCKIALDKFFEHKKVDFIKADIEGAELQLLGGAEEILQQPGLKLALCTYHYHDDAKLLKEKLLNAGFQVEFSKGYCFLHLDVLSPPYLRRGVIRAKK